MKRDMIPEVLGIFISLGGAVVMAGWLLHIEVLKSILPIWVSMKFSTALAFFFSGIILYFTARFKKRDKELAEIIIPIMSMLIFLLMTSLLASTILGVNVGVEEMFVKDSIEAVGSVAPGRPSIATMVSFIFIASLGVITIVNSKKLNIFKMIIEVLVVMSTSVAILGYCINQPLLYCEISGKSSAMALHTAILFLMWGIGKILIEIRRI